MDFGTFFKTLESAFLNKPSAQTEKDKFFLSQLAALASTDKAVSTKMMELTVLLEGFYIHTTDADFKKTLLAIRIARWEQHFGTPTVPFLLTWQTNIQKTKQFFDEFLDQKDKNDFPWLIHKENFYMDKNNDVMVDIQSISKIIAPPPEIRGIFTKTHNPIGGFTTTPCDPISQEFISQAAQIAQNKGAVLEIGAGFGAATLQAIAQGAKVFCNDSSPENLAVVRNRHNTNESTTGDDHKLVLVPGMFPDELSGLPKQFFHAILICRVFHFSPGKKIDESLALLANLLVPGGKLYIVCETPFLKNWQRFIPEFEKRVAQGCEWPGEITNPAEFESSGRAASLPTFVHWITKEVLDRSLIRAGFSVEKSTYINRKGQFPDDLLLPEIGQESVGAIGVTGEMDHASKNTLV